MPVLSKFGGRWLFGENGLHDHFLIKSTIFTKAIDLQIAAKHASIAANHASIAAITAAISRDDDANDDAIYC